MNKIMQYLLEDKPYAIPLMVWYASPLLAPIIGAIFFGGLGLIIGSLMGLGFVCLSVVEGLHVDFCKIWEGYADWKRKSNQEN